jgi:GNAT superfamily N-acetyltransferase
MRRSYQAEADFWRIRNFLREIFLLNNKLEHCWHVARLDYWRWHLVLNCEECGPIDKVTYIWETSDGKMAAFLNPVVAGEIRLQVHPQFRTPELEDEMLAFAEEHLSIPKNDGKRRIHFPVDADDVLRQTVLLKRGYSKQSGTSHKWRRDLESPIPETSIAAGYDIRSMGGLDEHPARSWASWRAFHADEPDENYHGDWAWYQNVQLSPLYRRDLDIVAIAPQGEIASFVTILYDDYTRTAVCVLVGTAAEHQRKGLGKTVLLEGFRRLQKWGAIRVFATAFEPPADALYRSVMHTHDVWETWLKEF